MQPYTAVQIVTLPRVHALFKKSAAHLSLELTCGVCVSCRAQVFSMFLETLVDFIQVHKEDLQDWLFVLLTQLLKKMGADLLGSVQAKVQKALDVTRLVAPQNTQILPSHCSSVHLSVCWFSRAERKFNGGSLDFLLTESLSLMTSSSPSS